MRTFIALLALLLSGCGTIPAAHITSNSGATEKRFSSFDWDTYNQIVWSKSSVALRSRHLEENSPVVQGIRKACASGVQVSVILYVDGRNSAKFLRGTCAEVYISDFPELRTSLVTLLSDGVLLVVNGNMVASQNQYTQQEYLFQRNQKRYSTRVQ